MTILDLFSKRQKRLRGEVPEVFVYDDIPNTFRVKVIHIIKDVVGVDVRYGNGYAKQFYEFVNNQLCREYGLFKLCDGSNPQEILFNYLLRAESTEKALDAIELTFWCADNIIRNKSDYLLEVQTRTIPDEAIEELNARFKEEGIGYSFEGGKIIRLDSAYTHAEIVKPTISLLNNDKFTGAFDEYLNAHEHYKNGRHEECLVECAKAFESVLKTICTEKGWSFNNNDTAKQLIKVCFDNELIPSYMQTQFSSLRGLLESGIPTIRNKNGAHGQGQTPRVVSPEITRYGLNLTGTNIIFLVEQSGIS